MYLISWSEIDFVEFIGIANPIPSTPEPDIFKVLIPITCPLLFTNAPPLFPEFIDASVWINVYVTLSTATCLFTALIIPEETLLCSPKGFPIAITYSPTCTESESPSSAAVNPVLLILITAKSVWSSVPTIVASYSALSLYKETVILLAFPSS